MNNRIVIVLHQETSIPGRVGDKLREKGYSLDIRRPALGEPLPSVLEGYAGAVIFGGPMSANDENSPFIREEIEWISKPLAAGVPFLGICLGGQMLARQLGGKVFGYRDERAEIGYYDIHPTTHGECYGPWPQRVYQWHREGFELARGSVCLARGGNDFPDQAFRYGQSAFAIQFHPEVTMRMMNRWLAKAEHRLVLPGARPRHQHFDERLVHDPAVDRWLDQFLDSWLASGTPSARTLAAE
jgi:GMP synthase (glutamine-hydrolysing)